MIQMWQYVENDEAYDDYDETKVNENKWRKNDTVYYNEYFRKLCEIQL